ncbi:YtfJ family protein [Halioxenophilus sp. WMMB6]|uniref:YtfJ family protein n=1 Tax=Halioxenophilus sp. WMMB6 TaxID=3073815 RepID=UPI00295EFFB1|nr:YtfJ family protein [Halioxenophilus sp. WMMB6]
MTRIIKVYVYLVVGLLSSPWGEALGLELGQTLPALSITDKGECLLVDGEALFVPWQSASAGGPVQIFEYVAARAGIDKLNQPFYQALAAAGLRDIIPVTQLVNSADALWGTAGLVAGEVAKSKKAHPEDRLVVDALGVGRQRWQLQKKSAAIIVLDGEGNIRLLQEGGMTAAEAEQAILLLRELNPGQ